MKIFYYLAYVYHRLFRFIYRKEGNWQSKDFENHHQKMKKYKGLLAIIAIVLFLFSQSTTADFMSEEMQTIQTAELLKESTVIITANMAGSGFFISPHEIITNHHVVNNAKSVLIKKSNGTMCFADVIYKQSETDLALLKTDCEGKPIPLAESVKVGQSVLAIGNPLFQEFFVSKGIVGLVNSNGVLHDAPIENGMSGGPVINLSGQLVGVSQAVAKDMPRMSIAINIKTLSYFMYQAKEGMK